MKLTDENGNAYEFFTADENLPDTFRFGSLKLIDEWPKHGDNFWYVSTGFDARFVTDFCQEYLDPLKEVGNCYRTKEEAEMAAERICSLQEASNITVSDEYENEITFVVPKKYLKAWKALEDKK